MRRFLIIMILTALPLLLGGCALFPSSPGPMERLAVVQALGVDAAGGGVRLSMVTAADSSRGEGPVRMRGSGATITAAASDAAARAAEEKVFLAHTAFLLLGEESAREDVTGVLGYVCRSRELRMDVPLLIVREGSAEQALMDTGGERVGAAELLQAFSASAAARLGSLPPSVALIAGRLAGGNCALAAAVSCELSSEQGGEGEDLTLAPAGLAVLQDGRLCGFIDEEDACAVDLLCGARGVHEFFVTDRAGRRVTLQSAPGQTLLRPVRGEGGAIEAIELTIRVAVSAAEIDGRSDLSDAAYADELSALAERELLRRAEKVVALGRTLGADLLSLRERSGIENAAALPLRLSAAVRVEHANDVRDG